MFGVETPGCLGKGPLDKAADSGRIDPARLNSTRLHRHCQKRSFDLVMEPF